MSRCSVAILLLNFVIRIMYFLQYEVLP